MPLASCLWADYVVIKSGDTSKITPAAIRNLPHTNFLFFYVGSNIHVLVALVACLLFVLMLKKLQKVQRVG